MPEKDNLKIVILLDIEYNNEQDDDVLPELKKRIFEKEKIAN